MNVFDIVGPVMIGPSSSHTAGAARIGLIARALLGAPAVTADIRLHGSFAKTYRGHGTYGERAGSFSGRRKYSCHTRKRHGCGDHRSVYDADRTAP